MAAAPIAPHVTATPIGPSTGPSPGGSLTGGGSGRGIGNVGKGLPPSGSRKPTGLFSTNSYRFRPPSSSIGSLFSQSLLSNKLCIVKLPVSAGQSILRHHLAVSNTPP